MCVSPIRIRNPNYHIYNSGTKFKDTESAFINVPCGVCCECVAVRQMSYIQRLQMEETKNHLFFCTLTYNDESMPVHECSNGYKIRFADIYDVQCMIKRLRKSNAFGRSFRYFGVSELGSKRGRPHFHLLFLVPKFAGDDFNDCLNLEKLLFDSVLFEWRRNVAPPVWSKKKQKFIPNTRSPIYKPLCTYVRKFVRGRLRSNFDLHYVNPSLTAEGCSDVGFYVTKYMMKPSDREKRLQQALHLNLDEFEYEEVWSKVRSRTFASLGLGVFGEVTPFGVEPDSSIVEYIRKCVDTSKLSEQSAKFYNPQTGSSFPLSRYYKTKFYCYSPDDEKVFFDRQDRLAGGVVVDDTAFSQKLISIDKHESRVKLIESHDHSCELDELYE